jgi:hypothetical protein
MSRDKLVDLSFEPCHLKIEAVIGSPEATLCNVIDRKLLFELMSDLHPRSLQSLLMPDGKGKNDPA